MSPPATFTAAGQGCSQAEFYAVACDPSRSVVVEACAGSGKTWLLVSRILRALLAGTPPQEILAITFTRKAAGEMRQRLNEWLHEHAQASPQARVQALLERGLGQAQAQSLAPLLAGLHGQVLASGRTVAISTFHAWFFQLMRAAPRPLLDRLGLHTGMALIDDEELWLPELMRRFHAAVAADEGRLGDYTALIEHLGRARLDEALHDALGKRTEIELASQQADLSDAVPSASDLWPGDPGWGDAIVVQALSQAAQALGRQSQKTRRDAAAALQLALQCADAQASFDGAWGALFTNENAPRKLGDGVELQDAVQWMLAMACRRDQQRAHEHHGRMLRLAHVLLGCWGELKRDRALADMPDLERCALACLSDPQVSGWVQQRLDAQVRQLLIDEFQDTSPLQWQALWSWLSSYAGAGGGRSGQRPPAVFIVGDPKQSIYRFRRADPRVFEAAQAAVVEGLGGIVLSCDQTRRNAQPIVECLNRVFDQAARDDGYRGFRPHGTLADARPQAGVYGLPQVMRERRSAAGHAAATRPVVDGDQDSAKDATDGLAPASPDPAWRDTLNTPRTEPETVLRGIEARHVAQAVHELIHGQGLAPEQVMVLARKRLTLGHVAQALREADLPHVAAEKLQLADIPEARDLMALLDVMASPGHDLSLAQVLKCPYFGVDDMALLALSERAGRGGHTWWAALMGWPDAPPELACARDRLAAWAQTAAGLPPHDALDHMLHDGDLLARSVAAAPPSRRVLARLAMQAVLAQCLEVDGGRYATPYNLVRALRNRPLSLSFAADAGAVQLLTVHGAKGLEAEAVILVDSDPNAANGGQPLVMVDWPVQASAPTVVAFVANSNRMPPSLQRLAEAEAAMSAREELNLLYVAMTRAKQQLWISATQPHRAAPGTWWSRLAPQALPWSPDAAAAEPAQGERVNAASPATQTQAAQPMHPAMPARVAVPALPELPADRCAAAPALRRRATAQDPDAARLGQAVHRLLEWTADGPSADAAEWARLADAAAREFALPAGGVDAVLQFARQVRHSPQCAAFFDRLQLRWAGNEVPIADQGEVLRIDRLVQMAGDGGWWVLDYKLSPQPQAEADNLVQLQRYRQAVQALQPGDVVRAAFITSRGQVIEP